MRGPTRYSSQAIEVSNRYAPEHLILQVAAPRELLAQIESAGSIFLGQWAPESVGDYCSGSNHVLPTYGHARSYSGATLAAAEQLEAHRRAVTLRLAVLEATS